MLWAATVARDSAEFRPGQTVLLVDIDAPDLELAHAVLLYEAEQQSFVAAAIVTSLAAGVAGISVFRSWPPGVVTRHSLFALVRDPVKPVCAPRRNTIPEPRSGFARMARSPSSPAYRAYALALEFFS
jgi:hypothetical protein